MHIMHVALGGCLKAPPITYGITQDTGGHIAYVLGAARAQVASDPGNRVTIVTRAFDEPSLGAVHGLAHEPIGPRLSIRRLRTSNAAYLTKGALARELPALRRALLSLVEEDRPDVLHAHFADAAELALAVRRRHDVPVLYTPHSLSRDKVRGTLSRRSPEENARLLRETNAIVEADAIVVSSGDEAERQIAAYDRSALGRTVVARPGVELRASAGTELASALIEPFLDEPERPFLLAIARPVRKKNLPALLEAYAASSRLRDRANVVVLAGQHEKIRAEHDEQGGELDRLHALVARHGLGGRVALPPSHAPEAVPELYRLAALRRGVFVNPARHEPFGLTLIEAARFGVPVVATRNGGPRDIVATLGHGRLVDPGNRDEIGQACETLIEDRAAYDAASRSALERVDRYTWAGWADAVAPVMDRLRASPADAGDAVPPRAVAPPTASSAAKAPTRLPAPTGGPSGVRETVPLEPASHFLAFDIDDTLTGCGAGAARLGEWMASRRADELPYAVATGRELPEAIGVLAHWRLPVPDVWITSVGTEIWRAPASGAPVRCEDWAARLDEGWDRDAILSALGDCAMPFQGTRTQRPWKVSLFGTASEAAALGRMLEARGFDVRVIASHGRFVDVVPRAAGKASAIEFEAGRRDIPMSRCVAAGNSGNDVDMLDRCGLAILVANALPEIGTLREREGLYRALAPHAHGVLEGLAAFGLRDGSADSHASRRPAGASAPAAVGTGVARAVADVVEGAA